MSIENIQDHMAFACGCGSVKFNLLRSSGVECAICNQKLPAVWWRLAKDEVDIADELESLCAQVAQQAEMIRELKYVNGNIRMVSKAGGIALDKLAAELDTEREIKTEYGKRIDALVEQLKVATDRLERISRVGEGYPMKAAIEIAKDALAKMGVL